MTALLASMPLRRRWNAFLTRWQHMLRIASDPYRPERHYMRGPGPRWHARHAVSEPVV